MKSSTQIALIGLALSAFSIGCFWLLLHGEGKRSDFVSKCVVENQTLPNPRDVCTAKYELWRRGS